MTRLDPLSAQSPARAAVSSNITRNTDEWRLVPYHQHAVEAEVSLTLFVVHVDPVDVSHVEDTRVREDGVREALNDLESYQRRGSNVKNNVLNLTPCCP